MATKSRTFHRVGNLSFDSDSEVEAYAKKTGCWIESVLCRKSKTQRTFKYNLKPISK